MLYAVIPFKQAEELRKKIDEIGCSVYADESPIVYFVSFKGTTRELSDTIGYGSNDVVGSGVVIPVSNYHGYASRDLWEWLKLYENGG